MSDERLHVIVNPVSAGGRTARRWPAMKKEIERRWESFEISETTAPLSGAPLCRKALEDGATHIMAVGGDSTFSELANGFFRDGTLLNPEAQISFLTSGSGCDMLKTFGWPQPEEFAQMLDIIRSGKTRKHDIGLMSFTEPDGNEQQRYFVNVASFGLGGAVSDAVNSSRIAKQFSGKFAFFWHALVEGLRYQNQRVRFQIDDDFDETHDITLAAVAICQYFGGGLWIAPEADPEDGFFDVLIGRDLTKAEFVKLLTTLVPKGLHLDHPKLVARRAKKLIATPLSDTPVKNEVDGESAGALASTFEILPGALTIRG